MIFYEQRSIATEIELIEVSLNHQAKTYGKTEKQSKIHLFAHLINI